MTSAQIERLPHAVHSWLSFQHACNRAVIFSESYLSQPIAEFVSVHHSGPIAPERNHPAFAHLNIGRPKQVDFALLTRDLHHFQVVIEAKWIKSVRYSKQAILDDILRLECFRQKDTTQHVARYFLVGGLSEHVQTNFRELNYKAASGKRMAFTTRLLPFAEAKTKVIDAYATKGNRRRFFRRFSVGYKVEAPKKFKSTLIKALDDGVIAVFLWRIASVQNRQSFKP